MRYALLIYPRQDAMTVVWSAYRFCNALIERSHSIEQVFFYADAVRIASRFSMHISDTWSLAQRFQSLAEQHHIPLVLCSEAAANCGLLTEADAAYYSQPIYTVAAPFTSAGIAQFWSSTANADRVITFS